MACPLSLEIHEWVRDHWFTREGLAWLTTASTSFALIAAAEIGDKSQLVAMTLAARHRGLPVLLGAGAAFGLLNLAAVVFGAAIAHWVPGLILSLAVAALFLVFGVIAWSSRNDTLTEDVKERSGHGVFMTAFLMIFLAEFGDKTQLATAGLSITAAPVPVWVGSTLALWLTCLLGIVAGRTVLQRLPLRVLHRISAVLFLALAVYVLFEAWPPGAFSRLTENLLVLWERLSASGAN